MGIPRDLQSDLHDKADEIGESVALGTLVTIEPTLPVETDEEAHICTCKRYSKKVMYGYVEFWSEADPACKYTHITPLPQPYSIKPA